MTKITQIHRQNVSVIVLANVLLAQIEMLLLENPRKQPICDGPFDSFKYIALLRKTKNACDELTKYAEKTHLLPTDDDNPLVASLDNALYHAIKQEPPPDKSPFHHQEMFAALLQAYAADEIIYQD